MSLTADQIGSKALEADFFLRKMPAATADLFEFRCYVSAFVSAVRGIPVAMEADLGARPDFRAWLETWQHRLDENRIARCFAGIRVDTLRISHVPAHLDRSHWVRFGLWESKHHLSRTRRRAPSRSPNSTSWTPAPST